MIRFCAVLILFFIFVNTTFAQEFGKCIQDPNAKELQNKWKRYHNLKKKRAYINTSVLVERIKMNSETMRFIQAISEVEELIKILDEVENKYLTKAFVDTRFNELIASDNFISKLESGQVDLEIKNSELKFKDDSRFYQLLERARIEIKKPQIKDALDLFRTYDLGILQKDYRKSAKYALQLVRSKGASIDIVRSWIKDPPYLRNVPYPSLRIGIFAVKYRSMVANAVSEFVMNTDIKLEDAKKLFPNIKQSEIDEMNSILPPVENNSFDDYIGKGSDKNINAIDGVARTLWGEATSCEKEGLSQFEAIGRIIADRSLAVERAIKEQEGLKVKTEIVQEKNWITFLKNWAGIKRPAPGMQNKPSMKLKGLSDFGRKENIDLHPAAQVISKKNQFSVWNSYSIKKYHVGQFHKNIPDGVYELQGPQNENDDKALIRILCPEFQNHEQEELWKKAVQIATEIVLDPINLKKRILWPAKGEILFYTHDANLSFAKEIKVPYLLVNGIKNKLRNKGKGACNRFRLFAPRLENQY